MDWLLDASMADVRYTISFCALEISGSVDDSTLCPYRVRSRVEEMDLKNRGIRSGCRYWRFDHHAGMLTHRVLLPSRERSLLL
jgi:hypothetical protein